MLSGFVMALKLVQMSFVFRAYIRSNRQQERRLIMNYKKKYLSSMPPFPNRQTHIKKKIDNLIQWYDEFTGMDEVRLAQKRVLEDEDLFRKAQENRRNTLNELTEIQHKLKDVYSELENTLKGDDRYLVLVQQEHKLLKEEKFLLEKFSNAEKLERDTFAALSSSVKLSHEKERAQSERTKYWSVIGSILGTVLGILGSSINSHFKMNELKQLIKNSTHMQVWDHLNSYLESNEKIMEKFESSFDPTDMQNICKVHNILDVMNKKLIELEETVKQIEKVTDKSDSKISDIGEHVITAQTVQLEESLKKEYGQVKLLLCTVAVLSVLMPIISRYSI